MDQAHSEFVVEEPIPVGRLPTADDPWEIIQRQERDIASLKGQIADLQTTAQRQSALLAQVLVELRQTRLNPQETEEQSPNTNPRSHESSPVAVPEERKVLQPQGVGSLVPLTVPKPSPFSSTTQDIDGFLEHFEAYCKSKFTPDSINLWTTELREFLGNEPKKMFDLYGGSLIPYPQMKSQLQKYYRTTADGVTAAHAQKYQATVKSEGETPHMFALRLEVMYQRAYPDIPKETRDRDLKTRFLKEIPKSLHGKLEPELAIIKTIKGSTPSWEDLVSLLRERRVDPEPQESIVWYNTNFVASPQETRSCGYCKKRGHQIDECRKRSRLCYACSSPGHYVPQCPLRKPISAQGSRPYYPPPMSAQGPQTCVPPPSMSTQGSRPYYPPLMSPQVSQTCVPSPSMSTQGSRPYSPFPMSTQESQTCMPPPLMGYTGPRSPRSRQWRSRPAAHRTPRNTQAPQPPRSKPPASMPPSTSQTSESLN